MKKSCLVVLLLGLFTIRLFSQEFSRNLEYKSEGDDVRQIQKMLVELGYGPINVNGEYDNLTVYAVREFKKDFSFAKESMSDVFTKADYEALTNNSDLMMGYKECIKKLNEIRSGKLKKGKKQAYDDNGFLLIQLQFIQKV